MLADDKVAKCERVHIRYCTSVR